MIAESADPVTPVGAAVAAVDVGTARNSRGVRCEGSRLGTLRVASAPLFHGLPGAFALQRPAVQGKTRLNSESNRKRGFRRGVGRGDWRVCTSGTQVVSRLGHAFERTPTVRPDSRDFGPLSGSIGAADHGDTKSARGDLASFDSPHPAHGGSCAIAVLYRAGCRQFVRAWRDDTVRRPCALSLL